MNSEDIYHVTITFPITNLGDPEYLKGRLETAIDLAIGNLCEQVDIISIDIAKDKKHDYKKFACVWFGGQYEPKTEIRDYAQFDDDNGYDENDRASLENLAIGDSYSGLECHIITRVV